MRLRFFFFLLSVIFSSIAMASDESATTPPKHPSGFEIRLIPHDDVLGENRIRWWLTLPDGTPLKRLGDDRRHSMRFFIPSERVSQTGAGSDPSTGKRKYPTIKVKVHAIHPSRLCANRAAAFLHIGQRHCSFLTEITLKEKRPGFRTNPDPPMQMIIWMSYEPLEDLSDSFLQMHMVPHFVIEDATRLYPLDPSEDPEVQSGCHCF